MIYENVCEKDNFYFCLTRLPVQISWDIPAGTPLSTYCQTKAFGKIPSFQIGKHQNSTNFTEISCQAILNQRLKLLFSGWKFKTGWGIDSNLIANNSVLKILTVKGYDLRVPYPNS